MERYFEWDDRKAETNFRKHGIRFEEAALACDDPLSHIWNYARGEGLMSLPNPCAGIKGFREEGRDVAPDDDLMQRVMDAADKPLQFAMRLAELTSQRSTDVRTMNEGQISGGVLHVKQGKTHAKLRIMIEGALAELLDEIGAFKAEVYTKRPSLVRSNALLITKRGEPLTYNMLRNRFDDARAAAGVNKWQACRVHKNNFATASSGFQDL